MFSKNKIIIKICMIMVIMFIIFSNSNIVLAAGGDSMLSNMMDDIKSFENMANESGIEINTDEVTGDFKSLGQILTMIGAGVMVGVATYMGIKYLTAGPDAQAKLKEQLIGVAVSGTVIFGAYFIWKTVIQIASNL